MWLQQQRFKHCLLPCTLKAVLYVQLSVYYKVRFWFLKQRLFYQ